MDWIKKSIDADISTFREGSRLLVDCLNQIKVTSNIVTLPSEDEMKEFIDGFIINPSSHNIIFEKETEIIHIVHSLNYNDIASIISTFNSVAKSYVKNGRYIVIFGLYKDDDNLRLGAYSRLI